MKPMIKIRFSLLLMAIFFVAPAVATEPPPETISVVVLPLQVNAEKDLSYLQRGIADMFASRLDAEPGITVVRLPADSPLQGRGVSDTGLARKTGGDLAADKAVYGSLTVFGESVSMDVRLVDVAGNTPPSTFYKQVDSMEAVIPAVNTLARDIGASIIAPVAAVVVAAPAVVQQTGAPVPEKDDGFWKSRNYKFEIKGLAAGDMDGDGKADVAFITAEELHIFRLENGQFVKIGQQLAGSGQKFIAVDAGDLNANGRAEIFVSCRNYATRALESFVLELEDKKFRRIADGLPWYFRVQATPGQPTALFGQKRALKKPFLPGIYRMTWDGNNYTEKEKLALPSNATVFGIAPGPVMDDGVSGLTAFDSNGRLGLYTASGEKTWKSDEKYGGSEAFIDYTTASGQSNAEESRVYLNQRILMYDINQDGKAEWVVVKNDGFAGQAFKRFRRYGNATFEALAWDEMGLSQERKTKKISNYISDFNLCDLDGDGAVELIAAVIMERDTLVSAGKSAVIAYDLSVFK